MGDIIREIKAIASVPRDILRDRDIARAGYARALLLKTGQVTQYNSELDDGWYQKGLDKRYEVKTTGAQSGTKNIDLAHYTAAGATVAFVAATKKITDSANGLAIFKTGDIITTSSATNPGPFTVATGNVAGEIVTTEALTDEAGAVVTLYKREAHSNNCVLDNNTGLMWSRYAAALMGAASDGLMPWTGQLYDIFAYAAAANAASLGGYGDWRVPNVFELYSLCDWEQPTSVPLPTAFPSFPNSNYLWTSSSRASFASQAGEADFDGGSINWETKSTGRYAILVRGG